MPQTIHRGIKSLIDEANAQIETVSAADAIKAAQSDDVVIVDLRDIREIEREGSAYHARMFASAWGVYEDPATGSAVAAFAGVVEAFERPRDGESMLTIEQGFEMGRPSLIALGLVIENGALVSATIGGSVVIVSSGSLDL